MKGVFITFEGIEGSGKSTHITLAEERLREMGYDVEKTREPGGTYAGAAIRKILLDPDTGDLDPITETLLFSAARKEIINQIIEPALNKGRIVLCDRFSDSTTAYQGYGRGVDIDFIQYMEARVCADITPDLTIVLDLPVEQGLMRANGRMAKEGRAEARFEDETIEFHQRVREGFLEIAKDQPDRVKVVDSSGAPDTIGEKIFEMIKKVLPEK